MNRMKIIVFIGHRHEKTGQIRRCQTDTEMQIGIPNGNRIHFLEMDTCNDKCEKRCNGQDNHRTDSHVDHGKKHGLNQEEFSAEFVVIGEHQVDRKEINR